MCFQLLSRGPLAVLGTAGMGFFSGFQTASLGIVLKGCEIWQLESLRVFNPTLGGNACKHSKSFEANLKFVYLL